MGTIESLYEFAIAVLLLCSLLSILQIRKTKKQRKLTWFETGLYRVMQGAAALWIGTFVYIYYIG
ncbi:hypothetical protein GLW04_03505 [Halobacillus litoralis]|uniref:Uncharacterized protein n=1 Tax=Halobacillus litoralis TaxID=45668 RepID=A0A845DMV9_9BACI|nr:hypothetical protein [Halobacillus litoralis]MYL18941.1 hypothetical protein [Halobacillus litoralis]